MKSGLLTGIVLVVLSGTASFGQDVPGSEDHPLIGRMPGAAISWYDVQRSAPYRIAVGPATGPRRIDEWVDVEGKLTRISYTLKGNSGLVDVHSSYANAAHRAGFEVLAEGFKEGANVTGGIGHRGFLAVHYHANPTPPGATQLLAESPSSGGSGYVAARLTRPEGEVYLVVGITEYKHDEIISLVDIVEIRGAEENPPLVDAAAMSRELELYGRVAVYGIYFDPDRITITGESKPTLNEIAKLLEKRADLTLYVVGHTDIPGNLQRNVRLSQGRAESVVNALVEDYGIARGRLEPHGVGPLAPIADNTSDSGRAKNRRVELVER